MPASKPCAQHGRIHPKRATPRCRTARVQSHARRARPPIAARVPPGAPRIPRAYCIFFPSLICLMQSPASRYGPAWLSVWPRKLRRTRGKCKKKNGTQHASARTPGRRRHSARGVRTTPPGSRRRRRRHGRDQRRARAPGGLHQGVHPPAAQVHQARPQGCARAGRVGRARARGVEGLFARAAARALRAARSAEWRRRAGSRPPPPRAGTQE